MNTVGVDGSTTESLNEVKPCRQSWELCKFDKNYEIETEYPYHIRRCSNQEYVREWENDKGYVVWKMSGGTYYKHMIVAYQWLDNPFNYEYIIHINGDVRDFHIENLRYARYLHTSKLIRRYQDCNHLDYDCVPEDIISVDMYEGKMFDGYYYSNFSNKFYFDTGINCIELNIGFDLAKNAYVTARDSEGVYRRIYYAKFKYQYGIKSFSSE